MDEKKRHYGIIGNIELIILRQTISHQAKFIQGPFKTNTRVISLNIVV